MCMRTSLKRYLVYILMYTVFSWAILNKYIISTRQLRCVLWPWVYYKVQTNIRMTPISRHNWEHWFFNPFCSLFFSHPPPSSDISTHPQCFLAVQMTGGQVSVERCENVDILGVYMASEFDGKNFTWWYSGKRQSQNLTNSCISITWQKSKY